jgi:hypothetical protein
MEFIGTSGTRTSTTTPPVVERWLRPSTTMPRLSLGSTITFSQEVPTTMVNGECRRPASVQEASSALAKFKSYWVLLSGAVLGIRIQETHWLILISIVGWSRTVYIAKTIRLIRVLMLSATLIM